MLTYLIYIEEVIIFIAILASIGTIFRTKMVYNRLMKNQKNAMKSVSHHNDYLWQVRQHSLKSCVGYIALITGMLNYASSMFLISRYWSYNQTLEANGLNVETCEVASSWVIVSYCSLF